jgi:antitoxin component YwqK of YwqJK toxin-antitoxin module
MFKKSILIFHLSVLALFLLPVCSDAQNRKEQIAQLNQKTDSLRVVLQTEKGKSDSLRVGLQTERVKSDSLIIVVSNKEQQLKQTNGELVNTRKRVLSLESELANENLLRRKDKEDLSVQITKLENKESILLTKIESINTELKINQEKLNETISENNKIKEKINTYSKLNYNNLLDYDDLFPSSKENDNGSSNAIFDFINEMSESTDDQQMIKDFNPERESPLLNGTFISYWNYSTKVKQPFAKGKFKNGLKDGHWIYYMCNGKKYYEGTYKDGLKVGKWINYDPCNGKFKYIISKPNDIGWYSSGYLLLLTTMRESLFQYDSYIKDKTSYTGGLSSLFDAVQKEIIYFNNGLASDTLYYVNNLDQIKLKVARNTGEIFFDNNQLFIQNYTYDRDKMRFFLTDNKTLFFYYRNGQIAYQYSKNETKSTEISYYENGNLKSKCEFKEGSDTSNLSIYDMKGKLLQVVEEYGGAEPGYQCACQ